MAVRQPTSLKAKALQMLAQRDHSRLELRRKLLRHVQHQAALAAASTAHDAVGTSSSCAPITSCRGAALDNDDIGASDGAGVSGHDAAERAAASEQQIDELLDWLAANRFLDESRFVESRAHSRASRFGVRRIEAELAQRGAQLDPATAERLRSSEFERARAIWARRFDAVPADAAERARQSRFLAGRGFSSEVIRRVLRAD